ncbi:MAG: type II secretion system F family protein [Alcaligenaceae bacterium]|nr:type II secretion system F family protein [Alcaligenaceae bacterium]
MNLPWTNLSLLDALSLAATVLALFAVGLYLHGRSGVQARLNQRLTRSTRAHGSLTPDEPSRTGLSSAVGNALQTVGRAVPLFSAGQRSEMAQKLISAGYRRPSALPIMVGLSAGVVVIMLALTVTLVWPHMEGANPGLRLGSLLIGAYLGMLLPRMVLDRMVIRRQKAIQRSFPDALDLLVVCTNAGLGLNAALQRVAEELEFMAPQLADELALTSGQLQLSGDPNIVLRQFAERVGLAPIRSLVSTLIQSRQFGTPIGHALRVLAQGERTARLMRTEEAAAKLATKITLPMMIFILPTVMIVAGGPAALNLMAALAK